jgi:hypothetical protein
VNDIQFVDVVTGTPLRREEKGGRRKAESQPGDVLSRFDRADNSAGPRGLFHSRIVKEGCFIGSCAGPAPMAFESSPGALWWVQFASESLKLIDGFFLNAREAKCLHKMIPI